MSLGCHLLWCKLSHYYHRWFHGQHLVYWNAVKINPIIVLFNYVSVFITCLFAWYWWRCEKEYNHCSLQLWRNCYTRNNGADARERNCEMLIAFITHGVRSVRYMNGICRSRNWEVSIDFGRCVDLATEKIQVISNCSIYER